MSKSRLALFLIVITLFVALLIFNDIRWNFSEQEKIHITLITEAKYGEEWERIIAGAEAAASEYGVELKLLAPDYERDAEGQINLLETSRAQGTDGMILAPIDAYELRTPIVNISDAGIPLVSIVTPVSDLGLIEYVGTDHYLAGQEMAKQIIDTYGSTGDMAIITIDEEDPNIMNREMGLRDYLEANSQIQIAETYYSVKDVYSANKTAEAVLIASKFEIIVGTDLMTTTGIADAVKSKGDRDTAVFGVDISSHLATLIDQGYVDGVVVQNYFNIGYLAVKSMVDYIEEREMIDAVYVDAYPVSSENLYDKEAQMILFPIQ